MPCGEDDDVIAAVRTDASGWIARLDDGRLVAVHTDGGRRVGPGSAPDTILPALDLASGALRRLGDGEGDSARREVDEWISRDWTQRSSGLDAVDTPMRRRLRRALDDALRATPRHRRAEILRSITTVRSALTQPLPLGLERALDALAGDSRRADWVAEAVTIVESAPIRTGATGATRPRCRALIVFGAG